ncbi:helix-turn-helix domain-containing protein [Dysgonomonas sp.]
METEDKKNSLSNKLELAPLNGFFDLNTKNVLTVDEAVLYTGLAKKTIYKMTSHKEIPHFKPSGRIVYFRREDLENWMLSNRIATAEELTGKAQVHCMTRPASASKKR